ncbi:MAG TPA: hypothetical protein VN719_09490 [Gemmatimonadales bacterium]|nr:hypothetical protein [Gemmatimonadales bacterium]
MRDIDDDEDDDDRPIRRPKEVNGLGVAAFIFGVLALAISWLPPYNFAVVPLGGIGFLLACLGLVISFINSRISSTWPATALLLCLMAFGLLVLTTPEITEAIEREWARQELESKKARLDALKEAEAKAAALPPAPTPAPEPPPPLPSDPQAKVALESATSARFNGNEAAAIYMLRKLIKAHPGTAEAQAAKDQLAEMRAKP